MEAALSRRLGGLASSCRSDALSCATMSRHNEWGQPIGPALDDFHPPPRPPRVAMQGRFCTLVPLDAERHGAELFSALCRDPDARRWTYLPYGPFEDRAKFASWTASVVDSDDPLFFTIVDGSTGYASGLASYLRIAPESGSIEVGHLNFSNGLQRKPAATEAMYLMMRNAFELGYRRYEWKCDALNGPSRAAALRLGLSYEGTFRQAAIYKGRSRDTAWYAAIDSEWPLLRDALETWLAPDNFDRAGLQRTRLSELTAPLLGRDGEGSRK